MEKASKQWDALFRSSFQRRLTAEEFTKFIKQLEVQSPIPGTKLAAIFFDRVTKSTNHNDPRLPLYIDALLDTSLVDSAHLLVALLSGSSARSPRRANNAEPDTSAKHGELRYSPHMESNTILQLTRKYAAGTRPKTQTEARLTFRALHQWITAAVAHGTDETLMQAMGTEVQHEDQLSSSLTRFSVGQLLVAVLENAKMSGILTVALGKAARRALAQAISSFIPLWAQLSPQLAARLENVQKAHHLLDEASTTAIHESGLDMALVQVGSVLDLPLVRTRAHFFILVSAMSVGLPLTDEATILSYLNFIYKGDNSNMAVDLITAAFDALSAAHARHETEHVMVSLRSFLINKIPIILNILLASTFQGLDMEYCITEALAHIDPTAFPNFSDSFLGSTSQLSDVRQDFVFSCTRHALLPATSVDSLLGEAPMTSAPTPADRYVKENLVAQCTMHSDKVESLIEELEKVDGNAGAIVQAVTEMLRTYCATKETMFLKNLCNALSRRPLSMGIMLQFTSPRSILQPLCNLLDDWRYEEDQGEYQPVYDEFAAILLLVLAYINRYSLTVQDIGIGSSSFIAQLLAKGHLSRSLEELSPEERKSLDGWILGLFNPEGEGISDEVMSGCRPQEFYLLVPTIVSQAVAACTADVLDVKTIKSGLEYLSLPFLFPSAIGTIGWLCDHVWEQNHNDNALVIQLFQKLTKPPSSSSSSSGDAAQAMHSTVMQIVYPKLSAHLQLLEQRDPNLHGTVESLKQTIKPHRGFDVGRVFAGSSGLPDNIMGPGGTLRRTVKAAVRDLTVWSSNASVSMPGMPMVQAPPATYSPRAMQLATRILGPSSVVQAIVEELQAQTDNGNGAIAIDVATTLICAPTGSDSPIPISWSVSPAPMPPGSRTSLNLREALKLAFDDAPTRIKSDEQAAHATVRLHRRVDALCVGLAMAGDGGLGAAAAAAAAATAGTGTVVDGLAVDTAAATQMELDSAMGLDVASVVGPMSGLLGDDALQQQSDVFDAAGMAAAGMDLTAVDLTAGAGDDGVGDMGMDLMPDGEDDMFAGLDLDGDLNFD